MLQLTLPYFLIMNQSNQIIEIINYKIIFVILTGEGLARGSRRAKPAEAGGFQKFLKTPKKIGNFKLIFQKFSDSFDFSNHYPSE